MGWLRQFLDGFCGKRQIDPELERNTVSILPREGERLSPVRDNPGIATTVTPEKIRAMRECSDEAIMRELGVKDKVVGEQLSSQVTEPLDMVRQLCVKAMELKRKVELKEISEEQSEVEFQRFKSELSNQL